MNYDWGKCCHHLVIFLLFLFIYFLNAFEIVIKKRSGTRSGTLHICGSTTTRDSWKIRKTQKKKKNVKN